MPLMESPPNGVNTPSSFSAADNLQKFGAADPVVIVGMSCRLPGDATSPSKLWELLLAERSGQCKIPAERFNIDAFYHPNSDRPGSMNTTGGYFLDEDVRAFENGFFGINNAEAMYMDPQQRKILELVYECFESAGATLRDVAGQNIGCYVGNFTIDHLVTQTRDPEYLNRYSATGMGTTILGNRVSHAFDLRGPSFVLDTACSSSLYSLHVACTALENGECTGAIVAGANLVTSPEQHFLTFKAGVLSPTSQCHTFDAAADGYARADGVGALYLKKLTTALRDRDPIRAVIRATAVNSNGKTPGITLPSQVGQEAVIRKAYAKAGIDFNATGYVECHGTGTPVGDPIEVEALSRVFSKGRSRENPLLIGAVKPNLGHSEAASGISGIVKVVLALENNMIPATIGIKKINPKLKLDEWNLKIVNKATEWPKNLAKRASVNSFGYGGANAHAILESIDSFLPSYSQRDSDIYFPKTKRFLLPLSATNQASFESRVVSLSGFVDNTQLVDLAYTLGARRSHLSTRGFIITSKQTLKGDIIPEKFTTSSERANVLPLAFVFTGQGAQWPEMGRELMSEFPSFRRTIQELDSVLQGTSDPPQWTLEDVLVESKITSKIGEASRAQPACTAIQIGLVRLLDEWGIKPAAVVGHSSGEMAAAYAAGIMTAPQAILAAYYRGAVVSGLRVKGAMIAAGVGAEEAQALVKETSKRSPVVVACVNSPQSVTISGDMEGIEQLLSRLENEKKFARKLNTNGRAYHSHHMKTIGSEYQAKLEAALAQYPAAELGDSGVRMVSSVTGKEIDTFPDAVYWRENLESPVLFQQAVEYLIFEQNYHVVEIGPHSALELPIKQTRDAAGISDKSVPYSSALNRSKSTVNHVLSLAGNLFLQGHVPEFEAINTVENGATKIVGLTLPNLPPYKWQYDTPLWTEPRASVEFRNRVYQRHELLGSQIHGGDGLNFRWRNVLKVKDISWLEDHKLDSSIVFPGAGYMAMAMEALAQIAGKASSSTNHGFIFEHVDIAAALVLPGESSQQLEVFTTLQPQRISAASQSLRWYDFEILTFYNGASTLHCSGKISLDASEDRATDTAFEKSEFTATNVEQWYHKLGTSGLNYGTAFRSITELNIPKSAGIRQVIASAPLLREYAVDSYASTRYAVHPITIDACFQAAIIASTATQIKELNAKVPVFIEHCSIRLANSEDDLSDTYIESTAVPEGFHATMNWAALRNPKGRTFIDIKNLKMSAYQGSSQEYSPAERHPCLRVSWKPDISRINGSEVNAPYFRSVLQSMAACCPWAKSSTTRKFLSAMDLLAHKDPGMSILELGGNQRQTSIILKALHANSAFKKFKSYTVGQITESGVLLAGEVKSYENLNVEKSEQEGRLFDAVIIPDDFLAGEYLIHDLGTLEGLLTPGGYLLAATTANVAENLGEHEFSTVDLAEGGVGSVFLATRRTATAPVSSGEVILVHTGTNPLVSTLESLLSRQVSVKTLSLDEIDGDTIPKHARVISLVEHERPFLVSMNEENMKNFKGITDKAEELVWVTGGALLAGEKPEFSIAYGLSRALMLEQPSLQFSVIDVDPAFQNLEHTAQNIIATLFDKGNGAGPEDMEFIQDKHGSVHISRFIPDETLNQTFRQRLGGEKSIAALAESSPVRLAIENPGYFGTLFFDQQDANKVGLELGNSFVEVDVKSIGLNAKDFYLFAGKFDTRASTRSVECAGIVREVGSDVTHLHPGDKVVVMAPGHFQTIERFPVWACQKIEADEPFDVMCTLPIAYATALYGLNHRAKLQKDEKVLIHSGAGGVGMAAIEIALLIGAEVFTTASTEGKKDFLSQRFGIPRDHIFSSRDSKFVGGVLAATDGEGVDVVLNSLTGDLLHDSWRCCAQFARFVEIGKRDINEAGRLDMGIFARNTTFSALDLTELYYNKSKVHQKTWDSLMKETLDLYRKKKIRAIDPVKTFDASEIADAFSHFNSKNRMGKIIISFQNPDSQIKILPSKFKSSLSPEKSYILVGCLGGLGRSLSKWMLSRGARKFVYLARSGTNRPAARQVIQELEEGGASVKVVMGNVIEYADVEKVVAACDGPIGGVVQGAMGLSEALFTTMTSDAWQTGIQPKVGGSFNLHHALAGKDDDLDFFLLLSSVSGSVGTATESNYCAANHFLDAFATYRRSLGKPASSVGLGMISEVGYLHENPEIEALLLRKGIQPLGEQEFLQILDLALTDNTAFKSAEPTGGHILTGLEPLALRQLWDKGFEVSNQALSDSRSALLATALNTSSNGTLGRAQKGGDGSTLAAIQAELDGDAKSLPEAVLRIVKKRISSLILVELEKVDEFKPLAEYGMDSMIAAEFRTWFYQTFTVDIPFLELLSKTVTVDKLSQVVSDELQARNPS